MSEPKKQPSKEKKSCHNCAYLSETAFALGPRYDTSLRGVGHTIGEPEIFGYSNCRQKSPSFNGKNLDNNSCESFLRKKIGMTLEQQIQEQTKLAKGKNKRKTIPQGIRTKSLLRSMGKCERCGNSLKNVTPHLHHKDGNPQNNKLSNLQVLCPNCHSNTKTFKRRQSKDESQRQELIA
jgi:5-methylcytosine-specific restriction endonuclease McrA